MYKYIYVGEGNHQIECDDQHLHNMIDLTAIKRLARIVKAEPLLALAQRNNTLIAQTNAYLTEQLNKLMKKKLDVVRKQHTTVEGNMLCMGISLSKTKDRVRELDRFLEGKEVPIPPVVPDPAPAPAPASPSAPPSSSPMLHEDSEEESKEEPEERPMKTEQDSSNNHPPSPSYNPSPLLHSPLPPSPLPSSPHSPLPRIRLQLYRGFNHLH